MSKIKKGIGVVFIIGVLLMLAGNVLRSENGKKQNTNINLQQGDNNLEYSEPIEEKKNNVIEETNNDMKERRKIENDVYYISSSMQIPEDVVCQLLLYEYIEYGLRKYSEENCLKDRYYCDIKEDMLPYETEFGMNKQGTEPYKTDLAKEIIPQLSSNIYNFKLTGQNRMLYMSIDTYNMKIYVYDTIVK